jgi:excinuclease UvrABC nuclease subunit
VRKRALLRRFGTVDAIAAASLEELVEVVPAAVARSLKELL